MNVALPGIEVVKMRSELASMFVIAAVACGGRGGEEPPARGGGTTDVPQTEGLVRATGTSDLPEAGAPAPVDDGIDAPGPTEAPVPVDGGQVRVLPAPEDPVPAAGSSKAQPYLEAWQARAPRRYVISTCGYGFSVPACSVEAVDEGRLVSRSNRFLPGEPWVPAPIDDGQEPVASLFEEMGRSIDGCTTSFELDPVYAYPSQIYFSCAQEGWGVRVTCFEPDTLDASRCQ
jgi:hypothetical protein